MRGRKIGILILAQCVVLLFFLLRFLYGRQQGYPQVPLKLSAFSSETMAFQTDHWEYHGDSGEGHSELRADLGPVRRGDYTISLSYSANRDGTLILSANDEEAHFIHSGEVWMSHTYRELSYEFRIHADVTNNFFVQLRVPGDAEFSLSAMTLHENSNGSKRLLSILAFLFLLVDLILWNYPWVLACREWILSFAGILFLNILPLFAPGIHVGHDYASHLCIMDAIAIELKAGHFPVRILSGMLGGYGEARSVFYGDLFLCVPALFRFLGFSSTESYKLHLVLVCLLTALSALYAFSRLFRDRHLAMLLTLAYTTGTYRLLDLYVRAARGEYTTFLFLPLIALALADIYGFLPDRQEEGSSFLEKQRIPSCCLLALCVSGIVVSHVLSTVIVTLFLVLIALFLIRRTVRPEVLFRLIISAVTSALLSAFFVVPFLDYYLHVPVWMTLRKGTNVVQTGGVSLAELFTFFRNPMGNWGVFANDHYMMTCGLVLTGAFVLGIWLLVKGTAGRETKFWLLFSSLSLLLSLQCFPWDVLTQKVALFNFLARLEYPYRFLMPATFFLTMLLGTSLLEVKRACSEKLYLLLFAAAACLSVFTALTFTASFVPNGDYRENMDFNEFDLFTIPRDYSRKDGPTRANNLEFDGLVHGEGEFQIEEASRRGTDRDYRISVGDTGAVLTLPVLNYKGYRVFDDNGEELSLDEDEHDLITVAVFPGYSGGLYLRFVEPLGWKAANMVSVLILGLLCVLGIFQWYFVIRRGRTEGERGEKTQPL